MLNSIITMTPKQMRLPFAHPAVIAGSVVAMAVYFSRTLVHVSCVYFTSDDISDNYGNTFNAINSRQYSMFRSLAHSAHRND